MVENLRLEKKHKEKEKEKERGRTCIRVGTSGGGMQLRKRSPQTSG